MGDLERRIRAKASELGFCKVGFTSMDDLPRVSDQAQKRAYPQFFEEMDEVVFFGKSRIGKIQKGISVGFGRTSRMLRSGGNNRRRRLRVGIAVVHERRSRGGAEQTRPSAVRYLPGRMGVELGAVAQSDKGA